MGKIYQALQEAKKNRNNLQVVTGVPEAAPSLGMRTGPRPRPGSGAGPEARRPPYPVGVQAG